MFSEKLNFGKYKNKDILPIWKGQFDKTTPSLIKSFISETIDFFFGLTDFNKQILSTGYSFSQKDVEFIEYLFKNPDFRKSIEINHGKIIIRKLDNDLTEDFSNLIIKFFNYSHYTNPQFNALKHPKNHNEILEFNDASKTFADYIADPNYIKWYINETIKYESNTSDFSALKEENSYYPIIVLTKLFEGEIGYKLYYHIQVHS